MPRLRAMNFTRGSVWPRFGSKLSGSAGKVALPLEANA